MSVNYVGIVVLLVVLAVVATLFALVDKMLKGDSAKKPAEKKTEVAKPAQEIKPIESVQETKPINTGSRMQIYNSELADDLNAMLSEQPESSQSSRLQVETHTNRESNISKYIHEKNYHGFDFNTDDADSVSAEDNQPMSFSREDYKKFMALSNIDDDKPL